MVNKNDSVCLRKINKPVISTDIMGNRNVEVRAVGAWVQPANTRPSEAVVSLFFTDQGQNSSKALIIFMFIFYFYIEI